MIDVNCGCGKRYAVGDDKAGMKMRCPVCKGVVEIPAPLIEEELMLLVDEEDVAPPEVIEDAVEPSAPANSFFASTRSALSALLTGSAPANPPKGPESVAEEHQAASGQIPKPGETSAKPSDKSMTMLEHLEAIEEMVRQKCRSQMEYLLMAGGGSMAPGLSAYAGQAGVLHSDDFGNVYSSGSPFSVGNTGRMGQAGVLRQDDFGNVFSGNSPFKVGNTGKMGQSGTFHNNIFGTVFSGASPFPIGKLE